MSQPTRREIILTLLEHIGEYDDLAGRSGTGSGDGWPSPNPMSKHPSVRELKRTINRLHDTNHTAWAHTIAYYKAEWRTVDVPHKTRVKGRLRTTGTLRIRQRIINGHISLHAVEQGRETIIRDFQGEPFLPDELMGELHAVGA